MAKDYNGWVAKDKDGDFWGSTFRATKEKVESHIVDMQDDEEFRLKVVKVKFVEVK